MLRIDDYILNLPEEKKQIYLVLREIIHETCPEVKERIAYGLPFFYLKKPFCYLHQHRGGVDLSFTKGYLFAEYKQALEKRDRSRIRSLHYKHVSDIDPSLLSKILQEGAIVDSRL
jgi:hypothetical protein